MFSCRTEYWKQMLPLSAQIFFLEETLCSRETVSRGLISDFVSHFCKHPSVYSNIPMLSITVPNPNVLTHEKLYEVNRNSSTDKASCSLL